MADLEQTASPAVGPTSRRAVVVGALGLPFLAACGNAGGESSGGGASSPSNGSSGGSGGSAGTTVAAADVPVGGGTILADQELVVTQPTEGEFKAFSSICTHQGCPVSEVTTEGIDCTCHGSVFSLEDGSPVSGPADEPLAARTVEVSGDELTIT